MDVRDYLRILRRQWLLVATCALLALGVAGVVTLATTPVYRSSTQVFVQSASDPASSTSGLLQGSQFSQQSVQSYTQIIDSPSVLEPVIEELQLDITASRLAASVTATAPLDTRLLEISVEDTSPQRAQAVAQAVSVRLVAYVPELETPEGAENSPVSLTITDSADLPLNPVAPRSRLNLALGLLVGLAVGVGAAVLRETLDRSVKGPAQLRDEVGVTTLGVIGFDSQARRAPLVVQVDPHSPRAEAFRQLRTNLQFVDVDSHPRTVLVTSPLPEEGKSTTAANLAITMAESGLSVALVEADLRRPKVVSYLGLEGAVGLTDVLIGRVELEDVLQEWGDGRLLVLPGGATPPNPSELLGSQQMRDLLARLLEMADMVVVDTSPTLPVTDAAVLANRVDGVLLVVRSGRTSVEQTQQALAGLQAVGARILGAVLTMAPVKGSGAYGYGYGYGYGYAPAPVPGEPSATSRSRFFRRSKDVPRPSGSQAAAADGVPPRRAAPSATTEATTEASGSGPALSSASESAPSRHDGGERSEAAGHSPSAPVELPPTAPAADEHTGDDVVVRVDGEPETEAELVDADTATLDADGRTLPPVENGADAAGAGSQGKLRSFFATSRASGGPTPPRPPYGS